MQFQLNEISFLFKVIEAEQQVKYAAGFLEVGECSEDKQRGSWRNELLFLRLPLMFF